MGYQTRHTLKVHAPSGEPLDNAQFVEKLRSAKTNKEAEALVAKMRDTPPTAESIIADLRKSNENAKYGLSEDGTCNGECKWYDHEEDMRSFSEKYPTILFELEGEGEENGDHWFEYYLNGKMQRCKAIITFEPYDVTKLE